jgi:MFS transporter, PHS family, inorganic phosphate transporter
MLGSIALIMLIDKFYRKTWLVGSFITLAIFFTITAVAMSTIDFQPAHPLTIVLYIICQFLFNVGKFQRP